MNVDQRNDYSQAWCLSSKPSADKVSTHELSSSTCTEKSMEPLQKQKVTKKPKKVVKKSYYVKKTPEEFTEAEDLQLLKCCKMYGQ